MNKTINLLFELSFLKKVPEVRRRGAYKPLSILPSKHYKKVLHSESALALEELHKGNNGKYKLDLDSINRSYWALKSQAPDFPGTIMIKKREVILDVFSSNKSVKDLLDGNVSVSGSLSGFLKYLVGIMLGKKISAIEIEFRELA